MSKPARKSPARIKPKASKGRRELGVGTVTIAKTAVSRAIDRGIDRTFDRIEREWLERTMPIIRGAVIGAIRAERRDGKGAGLALIDARHAIIKASRKDKLGAD